MRSVLIEDLIYEAGLSDSTVVIEGKRAHHLINVVRLKPEERILVLNGVGGKFYGRINSVSKKSVEIEIETSEECSKKGQIDLALCLPKKDAFEEAVRFATEIGFSNIYPLKSTYSSQQFSFTDRLKRVIESALIQSNNPFYTKIEELMDFNDLFSIFNNYELIFYFSASRNNVGVQNKLDFTVKETDSILVVIGPEGGLSPEEEDLLVKRDEIKLIHLPSYILRTQTCVCVASGYIFGKLN